MSPGVIQVRADICGDCPTPCERQRDGAFHATPCASCHLRRWSIWGACEDASAQSVPSLPAPGGDTTPHGLRGLGDLVAKVAEPIAKVIGLDKAKCGCAKRQEALNELIPFKKRSASVRITIHNG